MLKRIFSHLSLAALTAGLTACGMISDNDPDAGNSVPVRYGKQPDSTGKIVVSPPRKPNPPAQDVQSGRTALAPVTLVGQSLEEIERSFGTPHRVRNEKPALVYEYATAHCALDIIFFMDIERKEFRALSYDVRAAGSEVASPEICIGTIRNARVKQ